jgi:hypothetical protein
MTISRVFLFVALFMLSAAESMAVEQKKSAQHTGPTNNRLVPLKRTDDPHLYDGVRSAAMSWQKAVLEKNAGELGAFALPEYKEKVESELRQTSSVFYRFFFGDDRSVHRLFRDSKPLEFTLIAHRPPKAPMGKPEGITACYYDASKTRPATDQDIVQLMSLSDISAALCMYFFQDGNQWYSNFEFSVDEGEPEETPQR